MRRSIIEWERLPNTSAVRALLWAAEAVFNERYAGITLYTRHGEGLLWGVDACPTDSCLSYVPYALKTYRLKVRYAPNNFIGDRSRPAHTFNAHIIETLDDGYFVDHIAPISLSPALVDRLQWIISEEIAKRRIFE